MYFTQAARYLSQNNFKKQGHIIAWQVRGWWQHPCHEKTDRNINYHEKWHDETRRALRANRRPPRPIVQFSMICKCASATTMSGNIAKTVRIIVCQIVRSSSLISVVHLLCTVHRLENLELQINMEKWHPWCPFLTFVSKVSFKWLTWFVACLVAHFLCIRDDLS